jgi:hypothetical protein
MDHLLGCPWRGFLKNDKRESITCSCLEIPVSGETRLEHLQKIRILFHNAWVDARQIAPIVEDDRDMIADFREIMGWLDKEIEDEKFRT